MDTKIGCNAHSRDYNVDHLVCCDKRMVKQAIPVAKTCSYKTKMVARLPQLQDVLGLLQTCPMKETDDDPFNWGSGPMRYPHLLQLYPQIH